jgi:tetratricopeptide (TPR) repeat protein
MGSQRDVKGAQRHGMAEVYCSSEPPHGGAERVIDARSGKSRTNFWGTGGMLVTFGRVAQWYDRVAMSDHDERPIKLTSTLVFAFCFALCFATVAAAQNQSGAQLGDVSFQTSCSPRVRPAMNRAVALLHSFQYQQAESAFGEVARQDPYCGMSYWGKAMSLYHQLWDFPDANTLASGRGYISEAEKAGAKTPTERDYIAAAVAFYTANPGSSQAARVEAYARAMQSVYKDSPGDPNAAGFYALALVNLAAYQDETANLKKAIAILQPMFTKFPNNPGLAHYLIHASDTPELAPEGLAAARRYAKIAPDSSHALHMPSHIFTRLGLWQESIDSNIAAAEAARKATLAHEADAGYQTHAMEFLNYAYLQNGHSAKARQVVENLKNVPGASAEDIASEQAWLAARDALESHRWEEAASLPVPRIKLSSQDATYFVRGMGEARSGNAAAARVELKKLVEAVDAQRSEAKEMGYSTGSGPSVEQQEVEAWIDFAEGRTDDALRTLGAAADKQDAAGLQLLSMPAREMLGDMLLEAKRPKEALAAYRTALKESPNRFDGLWGAARAAQDSGDASAAKQYYSKLLAVCGSSADRPELKQAHEYVSTK